MARVKVTRENIKIKLNEWRNGINTTDELIFLPSEGIDTNEIIIRAWENNMVIKMESNVSIFSKFVFIEKL